MRVTTSSKLPASEAQRISTGRFWVIPWTRCEACQLSPGTVDISAKTKLLAALRSMASCAALLPRNTRQLGLIWKLATGVPRSRVVPSMRATPNFSSPHSRMSITGLW
jgi:hypothetical protein